MEQTADGSNRTQSRSLPRDGPDGVRAGALGRFVLLCAFLLAAVLVVHLTPVRVWLEDAQNVRTSLKGLGPWVYPASTLGVAVLSGCGVPRLLLCALGGMTFGFWIGLLITLIGTLVGHYAVFLFIRWGGRDWVLGRWPGLRKWGEMLHAQGVAGVFLVRQLPGHSMLANLCLGLSHVTHRDFLIGTAFGVVPEAIPATLIGAGLIKTSLTGSARYIALATAGLAAIWIACGYALRSMRKKYSISGQQAS